MDFTEYILNWDSNLKFAKEMQIGKFLACAGGSIKTFQFLSFVCPENYFSSLMVPVHIVLFFHKLIYDQLRSEEY